MKKIPNLFLKGFASVRANDGFQFGVTGHSTMIVKRRFTENFKSHYTKFDDQTDYILVQPVNPVALKGFLNDMKGTNVSGDELIRLLMEQL
jgi:hypothetical protein